jgi:hypothetical protein
MIQQISPVLISQITYDPKVFRINLIADTASM